MLVGYGFGRWPGTISASQKEQRDAATIFSSQRRAARSWTLVRRQTWMEDRCSGTISNTSVEASSASVRCWNHVDDAIGIQNICRQAEGGNFGSTKRRVAQEVGVQITLWTRF